MASRDAGAEPAAAFTLEETARRLGWYRWVEMRTFEVVGGWVAEVPEPEAKLLLGSHGRQHGWHAGVWLDRTPSLAGAEAAGRTGPASGAVAAFMDAFAAGAAGPEHTIEKLAGLYRVLVPHKVAAYTHHLACASPVADAPLARWLRFVLDDETTGRDQGEGVLRRLLRTEADAGRAADHVRWLEALMAAAGGIAGGATLAPPGKSV